MVGYERREGPGAGSGFVYEDNPFSKLAFYGFGLTRGMAFQGTALPSIIAAHAGAKEIYITDHPLSPALTTGSIHENVKRNLQVISTQNPSRDRASENGTPLSTEPNPPKTQITILPHTWGSSLSTPSSSLAHTFTKILIADCLWMPSQHANLVRTIKHFLRPVPAPTPTPTPPSPSPNPSNSPPTPLSGSPPCALLVAGFHTGRGVVAEFFRTATAPSPPPSTSSTTQPPASASAAAAEAEDSGQLTLASLHELDVSDGTEREFLLEERHGEGRGREEDRRWCVVGVLTLTGGCGGEEGEGTGTLKEEEKEGGKIAGKGLRRGRGGDGKQGLKGKGKEGGGGGRGGDGEEEEEEEVDMQDLALPAVALNVDEVGWV